MLNSKIRVRSAMRHETKFDRKRTEKFKRRERERDQQRQAKSQRFNWFVE